MLNRSSILSLLKNAKPLLEKKYSIKDIALFGSYSRMEERSDSDIDLLVDFNKPIGIEFVDLADELEMLLHQKVELVSLNAVKPKYLHAIKQDLLYV